MRPTDEQDQGTFQNILAVAEWSPNLTINHLPDELLLEIFDSYRQGLDSHDHLWREEYVWLNLTYVCKKWRAIMFASTSRLDLGITVGPKKPGHIKTILSGTLPIFIKYHCVYGDMTGSALWRMRSALKQRDRVREISIVGTSIWFDKLFPVTNCTFPELESIVLRSKYGDEVKFPATFLGGPDLSNLHLQRLELDPVSLKSISRFLLSTSALTHLFLEIDTAFGTTPETSLLTCLQGMTCLCSLHLFISSSPFESLPPPPTPEDIVSLSKLTCFHYGGHSLFLDIIVAGLSAPSLRDFNMKFSDANSSPILHLSRFINEIKERYHATNVIFHEGFFRLSLLTELEYINHCKPRFKLCRIPRSSLESVIRISGPLSMKLTTVEELTVIISGMPANVPVDYMLLRRFYKQFPSVKVLRTKGANYGLIARTLLQDCGEPDDFLTFFPSLEEIMLGPDELWSRGSRSESELAAFDPFVSAREQAGRPVKVFFSA